MSNEDFGMMFRQVEEVVQHMTTNIKKLETLCQNLDSWRIEQDEHEPAPLEEMRVSGEEMLAGDILWWAESVCDTFQTLVEVIQTSGKRSS
jgi:hypothetical protein